MNNELDLKLKQALKANHPKVRNTLQTDHIEIYNIMTKNNVKSSIKEF